MKEQPQVCLLTNRSRVGEGWFDSPEDLIGPIFEAARMEADCPVKRWQSVRNCDGCEHFAGIGTASVGDEKMSPTEKYRVMCRAPLPRRLTKINENVPGELKAQMEKSLKKEPSKTEREVFFHTGQIMNCPKAKKHLGEWKVKFPLCMCCDHYRGLRVTIDKFTKEEFLSSRCAMIHAVALRQTGDTTDLMSYMLGRK